MNKFDHMGKDAMNRMEDIMNSTRLNEFLHRKEEEDKKKNGVLWALAIIGAVAAIARSRMRYIVSLHRIIWRISRTILMMTLTTTFSRMRLRKSQRQRNNLDE